MAKLYDANIKVGENARSRMRRTLFGWSGWIVTLMLLCASHAFADPMAVRTAEGAAHADLVLRTGDGKVVASGDLAQASAATE